MMGVRRQEACNRAGVTYTQLANAYWSGRLARPEWSGGHLYNDQDIEEIREHFNGLKRGIKAGYRKRIMA